MHSKLNGQFQVSASHYVMCIQKRFQFPNPQSKHFYPCNLLLVTKIAKGPKFAFF